MAQLWTRNFILLIIASAFSRCSFDILLPTLPLFLTDNGISEGQAGIVMGIFTLSAIVVRFFTAEGARRLGIKRFLYIGLAICAAASAAYGLGTTFAAAANLRIIHGFGFGLATTLTATIAAGVIPAARRGEGFGYLGFGALITAAVAPFLGLWLINDFGYGVLFAFTALTQLGCMACMAGVVVENAPALTRADGNRWAILTDIVDKAALFPAALTMLLGVCLSSVMCFVALYGKEIGIANIGWFFLFSTGGAFTVRLFSGRIYDRFGRSWVLIPGMLLIMTGLIMISQATSVFQLVVAAWLFGFGSGAVFPSLQAWVIGLVVPERHNQANAMFYNALDVGVGGGAIVLGFIVAATGYAAMYVTAAAVMAVMLATYSVGQLPGRRDKRLPPVE